MMYKPTCVGSMTPLSDKTFCLVLKAHRVTDVLINVKREWDGQPSSLLRQIPWSWLAAPLPASWYAVALSGHQKATSLTRSMEHLIFHREYESPQHCEDLLIRRNEKSRRKHSIFNPEDLLHSPRLKTERTSSRQSWQGTGATTSRLPR